MAITLGSFAVEVSLSYIYLRVPGMGELCAARGLGLTWNGWAEYRQHNRA